MKRLLVYLVYDRQNIIDDYIGHFLRSMRPVADSIIAVCNMPCIERGISNLSAYADGIFYRENVGLDCGGFKDALCRFIGWEKLEEYDELVLANDSFYGPFEDVRRIFEEMEGKNLDFWGLMKRGKGEYGMTGSDPEHILSFFYAFQAPLVHSGDFRSYWEEMPYYEDYMTVVKRYERQLTRHFSELGYAYGAYADTGPNESANPKNQFFQCDHLSYEMIAKRKFPFLKRKQLSCNRLHVQTQENLAQSIAYVDRHTDYDADLIWKNLIRVMNPADLQRSLGLQYVLNGDGEAGPSGVGGETGVSGAVVILHAFWMNAVETACEYLDKVRPCCDIRIYAEQADIAEEYERRGYDAVWLRASDMEILCGADLARCRYLCLIHDCDLSSERIPSCTGKSYFFNVWENLMRNAGHLSAVVKLLDERKFIGMLTHPVPIFGAWIGRLGWDWADRHEEIRRDAEELGLRARMDPDTPPVHVTSNFWARADVVRSLAGRVASGRNKERMLAFPYEYLWSYAAQDGGYLTGIVESAFYASMNEVNYHHYLRTLMGWMSERYGARGELREFEEIFRAEAAAERYRKSHGRFYVYGTGEIAERCYPWLKEAVAFLVSDGHATTRLFHGKPVICLSELEDGQEYGVILCLSRENSDNVVRLLKRRGISDYCLVC